SEKKTHTRGHTDRHTYRIRHTHTETHKEIHKHTTRHTHTNRHTQLRTIRHTHIQTQTQTQKHTRPTPPHLFLYLVKPHHHLQNDLPLPHQKYPILKIIPQKQEFLNQQTKKKGRDREKTM